MFRLVFKNLPCFLQVNKFFLRAQAVWANFILVQSFTESTLTSPRVARWGEDRVLKSVTDKYKIWLKGGCFTCLILIGTIAIVLTVLPILCESTLKVEINKVGLGQLFDLLKAFFCVYSSPEKLLAPRS